MTKIPMARIFRLNSRYFSLVHESYDIIHHKKFFDKSSDFNWKLMVEQNQNEIHLRNQEHCCYLRLPNGFQTNCYYYNRFQLLYNLDFGSAVCWCPRKDWTETSSIRVKKSKIQFWSFKQLTTLIRSDLKISTLNIFQPNALIFTDNFKAGCVHTRTRF